MRGGSQTSVWTPERLAILIDLVKREGLSTKAAAARLSVITQCQITKNSAIGALDRAARRNEFEMPPGRSHRPVPTPPAFEYPEPKGCRWIFGEPGKGKPYHYCGESVTEPGSSWCAEHAAIVWNPGAKHQPLPVLPKDSNIRTVRI